MNMISQRMKALVVGMQVSMKRVTLSGSNDRFPLFAPASVVRAYGEVGSSSEGTGGPGCLRLE